MCQIHKYAHTHTYMQVVRHATAFGPRVLKTSPHWFAYTYARTHTGAHTHTRARTHLAAAACMQAGRHTQAQAGTHRRILAMG